MGVRYYSGYYSKNFVFLNMISKLQEEIPKLVQLPKQIEFYLTACETLIM